MSDDQAGFKAFQGEWEAESSILFTPEGERKAAHLRVCKGKGGLVHIDLQIAENQRTGPAEHFQIVVGQAELMRRLSDPQEMPPPESPASN